MADFKLSAVLVGHEDDVRAVVFPTAATVFSASRDTTVRRWELAGSTQPDFDSLIFIQGTHWNNAIAYTPPSEAFPHGAVATAGREAVVYVKPANDADDNQSHLLIGHSHNITCLAFSADGNRIVSGGWDCQVAVWDMQNFAIEHQLPGHEANVWGLLVYDERLVLTACADKMIRVFDISGTLLRTIKGHTDVVRCFCKLPESHWSGASFASAGNDEVVRLWTMKGKQVGLLEGHTGYIYSLAVLPNGDIVSSSEDRTVRVWRGGECIQTITHPAISIWAVAACPETGDIVTGASDNMVRVFSRDPKRQADAKTLATFEESNKSFAIPAETASQGLPFNVEDLPGPAALTTKSGQRDGEQLLVRQDDGTVTAHIWSASSSQWNLIGTVVSGEGSGSQKKLHNGKEYDYVFDVDIQEGAPPLKLPFNANEDPWVASRRFLEDNNLPMTYYEQVAAFIQQNTAGTRLGPSQPRPDPYGTERRYKPGDALTKRLPAREYVVISEGNPQAAIDKLASSAKMQHGVSETDVEALQPLAKNISDPSPTKEQLAALLKAATEWPSKERVPAIALFARLAVAENFVFDAGEGVIRKMISSGLLSPGQETANNVVHSLRLLVNLFFTTSGRSKITEEYISILEAIRPFASKPESVPQYKALAALYLNLSILISADRIHIDPKDLVVDIATQLECESPNSRNAQALYRALSALGNLVPRVPQSVKAAVGGTLHFALMGPEGKEHQVQELVQEIRGLL
ncbi:PFU-domain-containing protein [Piedraia hortae CBS 480.64]|uniref:PFU-domain-containing protein n=1 Tax=Piedraia hortae CBS 480.64 TaxID=1314780 RepID=A0A6A7BS52_9PEZI|nr:PFU-domain-containing protein [Piedraia hortae CBS 480.64]